MNIHVIDWHSKGLASVPNPIRGGLSLLKGELPPDRLLLLVLLLRFIGQRGSAPYWSKLVQRTGEIFTTSGDVRRIWSCGNRVPICTVYIIYCMYTHIHLCSTCCPRPKHFDLPESQMPASSIKAISTPMD